MRWKLLRRRFSVSAPRMIVRSHLPWPLRWLVVAVMLGFSAALALWAFEFGKELAGLERGVKEELAQLRVEAAQLRAERDKAQAIANTAESLLKTEQAAQARLADELKQAEANVLALKGDLGFFEQLLPVSGDALEIRGVQVDAEEPGRLRYQILVMQGGRPEADFVGQWDLQITGVDGTKPWSYTLAPAPLRLRHYIRLENVVQLPPGTVLKAVQVQVTDGSGSVRASRTVKY